MRFFEFRQYFVKPEFYGRFLQMTEKHLHLRTAHSPLVGYWAADLGGLNQVAHLWQYESFEQRKGVREALTKDEKWQSDYFQPMLPMLSSQTNAVFRPFAFYPDVVVPEPGHVYELRMYRLRAGAAPAWSEAFQKGFEVRKKLSAPSCIMLSDVGPLNTVLHIWPYTSWDERDKVRAAALKEPVWVETVKQTMPFIHDMQSICAAPISHSQLK